MRASIRAVVRAIVPAIDSQIHLASEARERSHRDAAARVLEDEFRNEDRVGEIGNA
jgi:hypothetical protein